MNPEVYAALQTAGDNLQPVGAWLAANWINLAIAASFLAVGIQITRWAIRDRRRTPAAPDNVPPVDDELLIQCRAIGREPLADPDVSRHAINYLRDNAGEEDSL